MPEFKFLILLDDSPVASTATDILLPSIDDSEVAMDIAKSIKREHPTERVCVEIFFEE